MTAKQCPILSVIMPSYNHAKFINDSIKSVVSQSVKELELIIVDDCSTDNSRDVIRRWTKSDDRVKVVLHDRNEGIARTCDDGIRSARGKYVIMMASDDMFKATAFEKILHRLESSDCGVVLVEGEVINAENRKVGLLFSQLYRKPFRHEGDFFTDLIKGNFVCTGAVRRSVIESHGISHDQSLKRLDDWLFWLDLSRVCEFVFIEEPLYYYRRHETNSSKSELMARDSVRVYDIILEKYGKTLDPQTRDILSKNRGRAYRKYDPSLLSRIKTQLAYVALSLFSLTSSLFVLYLKVRGRVRSLWEYYNSKAIGRMKG